MENINDIINSISDEKLDAVICALNNRKKSATKRAVFDTLFNTGHILEVQYNDNSLIYLDKIINVYPKCIQMRVWSTDIIVGLEIDDQDAVAFSHDAPSFGCYRSKIIINGNEYKIRNLTSCRLNRGIYASNIGGHCPIEHDAMKSLANCCEKIKEIPKVYVSNNSESHKQTEETDINSSESSKGRLFKAFRCMQEFLNVDSNTWIYFTSVVEKETSKDGFKSTRKSKISQPINHLEVDDKTGQIIGSISDSDKIFAFNINDFSEDIKTKCSENKKWVLIDKNNKMEFEFFNSATGGFIKENRIDPTTIII